MTQGAGPRADGSDKLVQVGLKGKRQVGSIADSVAEIKRQQSKVVSITGKQLHVKSKTGRGGGGRRGGRGVGDGRSSTEECGVKGKQGLMIDRRELISQPVLEPEPTD